MTVVGDKADVAETGIQVGRHWPIFWEKQKNSMYGFPSTVHIEESTFKNEGHQMVISIDQKNLIIKSFHMSSDYGPRAWFSRHVECDICLRLEWNLLVFWMGCIKKPMLLNIKKSRGTESIRFCRINCQTHCQSRTTRTHYQGSRNMAMHPVLTQSRPVSWLVSVVIFQWYSMSQHA